MAASADQMDDTRALSAAKGALAALKRQIGATVRDNAYWDDAYTSLNADEEVEDALVEPQAAVHDVVPERQQERHRAKRPHGR